VNTASAIPNDTNEVVTTSRDERPWSGRQLHFVGIGGCGMSGLALLASHLGATVTGSDQKNSIFTDSLGNDPTITIAIGGHDAENVPPAAELIYSSAVKDDNVERVHARSRGQNELHRSGLLAQLTRERRTVAVAGAHGKTTTSALLAHVLTEAGADPSYIVGGLLRPPAAHARGGKSEILVIEADESDRSLMNYEVDTAVITNIDLDHVGDAGGFANRTEVATLLRSFADGTECVVTTPPVASELELPDRQTIRPNPSAAKGAFFLNGHQYRLNLPGEHNVTNASLVVATALHLGCTPAQIDAGLASFPGLARRFELRGTTPSGARIFDDYAHHPAEVAAAIRAARTLTSGPVVAVFQPHLFSRTAQFAREFAAALSEADFAILDSIYPARETQDEFPDITSKSIVDRAAADPRKVVYPSDESTLLSIVRDRASDAGSIILLLGAGDVGRLAEPLLRAQ
jgi:UDP-N-acetylmuramate--alanine ligase